MVVLETSTFFLINIECLSVKSELVVLLLTLSNLDEIYDNVTNKAS